MTNQILHALAGRLLVITVLVPALTNSVSADPLGLVTLGSDTDAIVAEEILGHAYGRTSNRFLVSASPAQIAELAGRGLEFEPVVDDVDPQDVYQVYHLDHPRAPEPIDLKLLGEPIDLGLGLRIVKLSRAAAASVSQIDYLQTRSLSELKVRFCYRPPSVASPLADEYPSDSLAARINQDSIFAFNQRLQDFQTRYAYTDSCLAARDWIAQKFRDWGYTDVTTPKFHYNGWHYNVMVVKPGAAEPDKVIVIGGHYDSINLEGDRWTFAPGADDDGSGVALTMEIARVLADVPLRKTVIFMPFAAEEIGLLGSDDAASDFALAGTKLEVMFNFDMVGYTDDDYWDIDLSSGDVYAYRNLSAATANRVTELIPIITYMGSSSDHYSFYQEGFNIVDCIESDFNYGGWHTNLDLTSRMNFPYLAEVTKMAVVSLAIVADAAYPVDVDDVIDPGDGQSLRAVWSDCNSDCSYMVYWGVESGVYTDSAGVPAGECGYTVTGLSEGLTYYFLVVGESPNGYRALYGVEGSGTPRLYPRMPRNLFGTVVADQLRLSIFWDANSELDLSHYNVYRRIGSVGVCQLYRENILSTSFVDNDVVAHVGYEYRVTAVDFDGYESQPTESVVLYPATFDGGPIVVDAFVMDHIYDPDQAEQEAWLDTVLGEVGFGLTSSDEFGGPVTLNDLGQYATLYWIDDDLIIKNIAESEAALEEFALHNTNMLISGYRTFVNWSDKSVPSDHLLYREFGLSYYTYTAYFDFIGAHGQNGWPAVQIDPTRGMNEWRDIPKLSPRPGAVVIATFDSFMNLPGWEGEPVGLAYETSNGKRVLLSFPLYYLTPASAQALLAKVNEYFGVIGHYDRGDLDHSGTIDIVDLVILLDHLFISQQPLADPEAADMNGRPGISIGDAFYLINYLFLGGPQPVPADQG